VTTPKVIEALGHLADRRDASEISAEEFLHERERLLA
jgi:hypothetical protein